MPEMDTICEQPPCKTPAFCVRKNACLALKPEMIDHPAHYGGEDNPYEVIKVLYAWGLDKSFCLGNAIKYIARHAHKGAAVQDLKKARWYLDEQIKQMENSRGQQDRSA